jgi:hypothetical protein
LVYVGDSNPSAAPAPWSTARSPRLAHVASGRSDRELVPAGHRESRQPSRRGDHYAVPSPAMARRGRDPQWRRARRRQAAPVLLAKESLGGGGRGQPRGHRAVVDPPDGQVHFYDLDVGTGSALLVRTANGHQILLDAGSDADKFAQAIGRALPPTARTIDIWLITGGRRVNLGAAAAVLGRFRIGSIVVADPDPWTATVRAVVQQA